MLHLGGFTQKYYDKISSLVLAMIMVTGGLAFAMPYTVPEAKAGGGDPFIAEIMFTPYNFAPRGWSFCDGQLLPISQNTALFSLLGTTYGGDGRTTVALPNMQGKLLMHPGSGPGLTTHRLGETGGSQTIILSSLQMPSHTHDITNANVTSKIFASDSGNSVISVGNSIGLSFARSFSNQIPDVEMNPDSIPFNGLTSVVGGGADVDNLPPYLVVNCNIALVGTFPSRN